MAKINTGILINVTPISAEQIKALEKKALDSNDIFVYLDEKHNICFMGAISPESVKELAWHTVHELSIKNGLLTKKVYKKQTPKTFKLDDILQKESSNGEWLSIFIATSVLDESLLDEFILE